MTNETEIDTIVIDKVMKFWDLLFCDCCYIGICLLYSPRVWRWSLHQFQHQLPCHVFSTCVEVIPPCQGFEAPYQGILHVCGGDPNNCTYSHTWLFVFSTCVEVILVPWARDIRIWSILHVCGGDPERRKAINEILEYSPRVWRWSRCYLSQRCFMLVFSTCVEVILIGRIQGFVHVGILHVCGGDPMLVLARKDSLVYSPRVWRWS